MDIASIEPPRYLTMAQVAEMVGHSERSVRRWMKDASVSFPAPRKFGKRKLLFKKSDVLDWIERQ